MQHGKGTGLDRARHVAYFRRCLFLLPSAYQQEDCNRMALVYFGLAGLDLLGELQPYVDSVGRLALLDWVYSCQQVSLKHTEAAAFGAIQGSVDSLDTPTLSNTYFAVLILITLQDDFSRLNREGLRTFLRLLVNGDGSYRAHLDSEFCETDLRQTYLAVALDYVLRIIDGNATKSLIGEHTVQWIENCRSYDGGFSISPGLEGHAGLTFCGTAALALSLLDRADTSERPGQVHWLIKHLNADGGFNGRFNKPSDTCYSFWILGSLSALSSLGLAPLELCRGFLLDQAQHKLGGFGLASLSLCGLGELTPWHAELCISQKKLDWLRQEKGR